MLKCEKTEFMRKQILKSNSAKSAPAPGELDVAAVATVLVTSESALNPIENAFDDRRGPGGSRWVADTPGEQTVILAFDTPQTIRQVNLEVEEATVSRTQEIQLSISRDGGESYRELLRQEFNFAPSGTTFEREEWDVAAEAVTHLRLCIKPDKGGSNCHATLISLSIQRGSR
jgi:hypothetical protein